MKELKGILRLTQFGFGIIECAKIKKKIKVDKKNLNLNFDGSTVTFEIINETDVNCYAKITSIPDFKNKIFVGIIHHFHKEDVFVFNSKLGKSSLVLCSPNKLKLEDNDFVRFKITSFKNDLFYGKILEKLGDFYDDNALTNYIIETYKLPTDISEKALIKADKAVNRYHQDLESEKLERKDLRNLVSFTIDPTGARDLDDAISIIKHNDGYKIYIHIADVSYFVNKNNSIDKEASDRSFSVYLPTQVIRMLPPILSENYCSLLPDSDKYAVTTEVDLDLNGNVLEWTTYKSIMRSVHKFSYEDVYDILDNKKKFEKDYLIEHLLNLKDISFKLAKNRLKLPNMKYDIDNKCITLCYSDYTHQMIEEVMILNNILVAKTLSSKGIKYPSRHHPSPSPESNGTIIKLINHHNNINLNFGIDSLQKIVDCDNNFLRLFNLFCIQRILTKAKYTHEDEGHWALNLGHYSHFTSPIRRMSDIISHRLIFGEKYNDKEMVDVLENINKNEKDYQKIDFLIERFKMIRFLNQIKAVGNIYDVIITDVRCPTITVFIPEIFYMYDMHVADFSKEKLVYNEEEKSYSGEVNIKIGDIIKLRLDKIINSTLELKLNKI
jgi:ribonuclease R